MKSVYLVVKTGVYRHELCGYGDSIEHAEEIAVAARQGERDAYHDFDIVEVFEGHKEEKFIARLTGHGEWEYM
jgi:hypothetical protein